MKRNMKMHNRPEGNPSEGVGSPNTFITPARNRILSFALAVCLLLAMTLVVPGPVAVAAVEIQEGTGTITVNATVVGFGGKEWWVIGHNNSGVQQAANAITLLAKNDDFGQSQFDDTSNRNSVSSVYDGSLLQQKMEEIYHDPDIFSSKERERINPVTLDDVNTNPNGFNFGSLSGQYVWPLSDLEANQSGRSITVSSGRWWLRTPRYQDLVLAGDPSGYYGGTYTGVAASLGVRPAFQVNLSSVIFTSDAAGGKSVTPGSTTLSAAEQPTGAIKLTLEDSGLGLTVTGPLAINAPSGSKVQISYTGAKTGTGRSVSVVIADSFTGKPLFYGRPVDCSGGNDNGIARFQLPSEADLAQGEYKLLVFNEEVNGDNCTDYASTPEVLTLNVGAPDTTKPTVTGVTPSGAGISIGTSSLSIEFSKEMDTVVTGTVSLNSSATVTGGVWKPDNRTIIYDLAGLDYDKTYTVIISGFQDTSGNVMDAVTDNSHQFTTESAVANPTDLKVGHMEDNSVAEGEDYSKTIPVDYKGSLPLGYSASGLPNGLSVNDSTGLISGQPDTGTSANSPYTVTVKVQEQGGTLSDTRSYTLNVTTTATDPSPVPNSGSRSSGSSGGSSTPDSRVAKTTLPASAFSWDDDRTLTINHDSITPLGLLSVRWDGQPLTSGTDYGVYQGSVIVRFGEDFMATQSPGDHTVRVEFLNHTGETTVTVGAAGAIPEDDNETYNPNTGGYPDGGMGATDNPNTGDGRRIWPALLLGGMGAAALVFFRRTDRTANR